MKTLLMTLAASIVAAVFGKTNDAPFDNLDFGITEDDIMPTMQNDQYQYLEPHDGIVDIDSIK